MKITQLAKLSNLDLAWRRITTGGNQQYKRYYREIYLAYEIALAENLANLHDRLIGGSFQAQPPERVYMPKASGLHRPISLLHIEDQIVLQAFANLAAKRMQKRRKPLQFECVFSNILEKDNSIFFFRRWQDTYSAFQRRIQKLYAEKMHWVGDFDLAAFYDTISHELLINTIYPRTNNQDLVWIRECLQVWSSERKTSGHRHGLPQGPLASDFLAECFFVPIDEKLKEYDGYIRYVDDVRLLGTSEKDVRVALIKLERYCRERGLIPQVGKFAIRRSQSVDEAIGMLPSIAAPHHEEGVESPTLTKDEAKKFLLSAIGGKPYRVTDKTRLRFVLYRAEPDTYLLKLILRLIPRHPEHTDAFFAYIGRFGYRKPIEKLCLSLINESPYQYIRGEAWRVLAQCLMVPYSVVSVSPRALTDKAIEMAKSQSQECFSEIWGACHFLCASEKTTSQRHSEFLRYQKPLLQALLAPMLPDQAFNQDGVVEFFLNRTAFEPGLSVCSAVHGRGLNPSTFGITNQDLLPSQVTNTLRELGVISTPGSAVDPVAEILRNRYDTPRGRSWHLLLGSEYVHAMGLLKQAEAAFAPDPSVWLSYQNSFHQTIFVALQRHFHDVSHECRVTIINRNGQLVKFGTTLQAGNAFDKHCPVVASCFRDVNQRRNYLPAQHAYDEKRPDTPTSYLKRKERNRFVAQLRVAYQEFVKLMP